MIHAGFDGVAMFGFVSGFLTLVAIGYRHQMQTQLPVLAVGMACCGVYAFLAGVWSVGFVLIALTASEFGRSHRGHRSATPSTVIDEEIAPCMDERESRITRMFGRT